MVVIPSFYEGCPATVMQAMACGSPLIASATGGSPEVSGDAGLLVDPHDPADIARKMTAVLSDEDLRKKLKERGLERASFFNWKRTAKLTMEGLVRAARKLH